MDETFLNSLFSSGFQENEAYPCCHRARRRGHTGPLAAHQSITWLTQTHKYSCSLSHLANIALHITRTWMSLHCRTKSIRGKTFEPRTFLLWGNCNDYLTTALLYTNKRYTLLINRNGNKGYNMYSHARFDPKKRNNTVYLTTLYPMIVLLMCHLLLITV